MSPAIIFRSDEQKERAIQRIRAIKPDQENPLAIWIGPYRKIRSLAQNSLYWRRVGLVAAATGYDREALHQLFKRNAFGVRVESIGGHMVEVVPSSARVSKGDFSELIEVVEEFIAENGIEESV